MLLPKIYRAVSLATDSPRFVAELKGSLADYLCWVWGIKSSFPRTVLDGYSQNTEPVNGLWSCRLLQAPHLDEWQELEVAAMRAGAQLFRCDVMVPILSGIMQNAMVARITWPEITLLP